jgi:hypothetical protein
MEKITVFTVVPSCDRGDFPERNVQAEENPGCKRLHFAFETRIKP